MFENQVEITVVVDDASPDEVGAGGDRQVARCQPVVPYGRKLVLRIQRNPFHRLVYREARKLLEAEHQLPVVRTGPGGVAGLEEKGQAGREALLVE